MVPMLDLYALLALTPPPARQLPLVETPLCTATPTRRPVSSRHALVLPPTLLLPLTAAPTSPPHAKTEHAPPPLDALPKLTPADQTLMDLAPKVSALMELALLAPSPSPMVSPPQTAPALPTTAKSIPLTHRQLETTAPCPPAQSMPKPSLELKSSAMPGKLVIPTELVLAPMYHALPPPDALLTFATLMESALNAMMLLIQETNAQQLTTKTPGTHAPVKPESAPSTKKPASQEVLSPESSSVPSCSSVPWSVSPSTAAKRTANLTMPCKRPSSE